MNRVSAPNLLTFRFVYRSIVTLIIMALCIGTLASRSGTVSVNPDEYEYVARGVYMDLFIHGEMMHPAWKVYDAYVQEKLPSYIYRIVLFLTHTPPPIEIANIRITPLGVFEHWCQPYHYTQIQCSTITRNWIWGYHENWVEPFGKHPFNLHVSSLSPEVQKKLVPILTARKGALVISSVTVILMYMVLNHAFGWITGLAGMTLLTINPLYQVSTLRATGDGALILFLLVTVYLLCIWISYVQKKNRSSVLGTATLMGLSLGMAVSSKLNGFLGFFYFIEMGLASLPHIHQKKQILLMALSILLAGISAFLVFYFFHPYIWANPIANSIFMVRHRLIETANYQLLIYQEAALKTIQSRAYVLVTNTLLPNGLYVNFYMTPIALLLFLVGLIRLLNSRGKTEFEAIYSKYFILHIAVTFTVMCMYLSLDWNRYYLPFLIAVTFVQAYGIYAILTSVSTLQFTGFGKHGG